MGGSGIAFYVSYIHYKAMYVITMERAWKDDSNNTKYSKITHYERLKNKATRQHGKISI